MTGLDDSRLTLPPGGDDVLMQVTAGVVALRAVPQPDGEMLSQALHGEHVIVHHEDGEFALVQALADRYVGWALMDALSAPALEVTHRVRAVRAYVYAEPSIKAAPRFLVSLGAGMVSTGMREGRFLNCERAGWVVEDQLRAPGTYEDDPADVAARYLHTPYFWGARESLGIDCSGLVQQAFGACGVTLPRDSDMQAAWAGTTIADWREPGKLRRNDLVFWRGHVAIMLDETMMLHANGYHMAVAAEPLEQAITRIAQQYGYPLGARRVDLGACRGRKPEWLAFASA